MALIFIISATEAHQRSRSDDTAQLWYSAHELHKQKGTQAPRAPSLEFHTFHIKRTWFTVHTVVGVVKEALTATRIQKPWNALKLPQQHVQQIILDIWANSESTKHNFMRFATAQAQTLVPSCVFHFFLLSLSCCLLVVCSPAGTWQSEHVFVNLTSSAAA